MTVGEALRRGVEALTTAGVDNPGLDARVLLGHALGMNQAALLRDRGVLVPMAAYEALLGRRAAREPVALIVGRQEFWSLDFAVSAATLIPRADSETLIEALLAAREDRGVVRRVLDLGTGTGCLLLAALSEFRQAWGLGVDISAAAAELAAGNAARLGLGGRCAFMAGDWAAGLAGHFDVVLSNPPYIPGCEIAGLMPEVARFEPRRALDGGLDGLEGYRALLELLPASLAQGGVAVIELGAGQASVVMGMAVAAGFRAGLRRDYGGVARALVLSRQQEAEIRVGKEEDAN